MRSNSRSSTLVLLPASHALPSATVEESGAFRRGRFQEDAVPAVSAAIPYPEGSPNRAKRLDVATGKGKAYKLAIQYGIKVAWVIDTLFDPVLATKQGKQLANMTRWFTPAEALTMATSANADLLALSGPRNLYPGMHGVVQEGALADLLLVDGNPLQDLTLVADPERNLLVIMKGGQIHKQAPALT
jgi:imidazolonepropionase-like amidohydrolase